MNFRLVWSAPGSILRDCHTAFFLNVRLVWSAPGAMFEGVYQMFNEFSMGLVGPRGYFQSFLEGFSFGFRWVWSALGAIFIGFRIVFKSTLDGSGRP